MFYRYLYYYNEFGKSDLGSGTTIANLDSEGTVLLSNE